MHYCRFDVVNGRRVANPCIFYWPLAMMLALFYGVWGIFVLLYYSITYTFTSMKKFAQEIPAPSDGPFLFFWYVWYFPVFLAFGATFWGLYMWFFAAILYFPWVVYGLIAPCVFSSTKTDR